MKQLIIDLDYGWVLTHRQAEELPANFLARVLAAKGWKADPSNFTKITVELGDDLTFEQVRQVVEQQLSEKYGVDKQEMVEILQFTLEEKEQATVQAEAPQITQTPEEVPQKVEKEHESAEPVPAAPCALEQIKELPGGEGLAAICQKISDMAPLLKKRGLCRILTNRSYLFAVDAGNGLTTALNLMAQLVTELGLLDGKCEPSELTLEAQSGKGDPLNELASQLEYAKNKLVCMDISQWMDKTASPEFRDFLSRLQKSGEKLIYVFRVPYLEQEALNRIDAAISDVMLLDTVSFVPLNHDTLQNIAAEVLQRYGFSATEEAWELFRCRLAEEKSDGRFYGIKTAKNVVDEMIFLKFENILAGAPEDNVIKAEDLRGMVRASVEVSAAERLERMIGVDKIRERLYEIIGQIEFARKNQGVNAPAMHMRFVGNPGTGKTTIARIVGQLLKERKILSRGYFFEHNGGDFLGMYVGHTAPKTLALCRDAYGSVLFIDEAYTLADANYSDGGYAKEAVDTLIAQMENHREDLVVIMAGYPNEMAKLMNMNPGLEGRMPYELVFPNYTREELAQIFLRMADGDGFHCGEGVEQAVKDYFDKLDDAVLMNKNFANARFARNLFERTWSKTVMRAQMDGSDPKLITLADFNSAAGEDVQSLGSKTMKHPRPGFRLGLV